MATSQLQENQNQLFYDSFRLLVAGQGSKIMAIEAITKDGRYRKFVVQQAAAATHVVGDAASESAKQGARTRAERWPNLLNVFDIQKQEFRSIDMDRILSLYGGGKCLYQAPKGAVARLMGVEDEQATA